MATSITKRILLASVVVILTAGSVRAQGDPSLLRNKGVQKELKITGDQGKQLDAFFDELNTKQRDAQQKFATASPAERGKLVEQVRTWVATQLDEILKPDQLKRLEQIEVQRASYFVFRSPKIRDELKLTDEQRARIDAITTEANDAYRSASETGKSTSGTLREEINQATLAKIVALMTPAQQATWKDLTGAPFQMPPEVPGRRNGAAGRPR